jgi:hypothetical protein
MWPHVVDFFLALYLSGQTHFISWNPAVSIISYREINLPVKVDPERKDQIKDIRLWASTDLGATWDMVQQVGPDDKFFSISAGGQGLYWFTVQVIDKKGGADPPDVGRVPPCQEVFVADDSAAVPAFVGNVSIEHCLSQAVLMLLPGRLKCPMISRDSREGLPMPKSRPRKGNLYFIYYPQGRLRLVSFIQP